ncbi:unnamed protein product, partial [marine sediment metagenome]
MKKKKRYKRKRKREKAEAITIILFSRTTPLKFTVTCVSGCNKEF